MSYVVDEFELHGFQCKVLVDEGHTRYGYSAELGGLFIVHRCDFMGYESARESLKIVVEAIDENVDLD